LSIKLFSLYKIGLNKPENTEEATVEEKNKRSTNRQHTRPRKKWPPRKPGGRLAMRKLIATQAHQSQGRALRTHRKDTQLEVSPEQSNGFGPPTLSNDTAPST
jgi:hypothetical protein